MANRRAVNKLRQVIPAKKPEPLLAFLGNLYTGDLFVSPYNYVEMFATLAFSGQVVVVQNKSFPARYKYPVELSTSSGTEVLTVVGEWKIYPNANIPVLPFHPHTWGETENVAWIRKEQILELAPYVKEGMTVQVNSGTFIVGGVRRGFVYQEFDMTSYIPVAGARWVTCEIDDAGVITYTEGTLYDSRTLLDISNVPAVTNEKYLLFAVKVYYGQTELIFLPDNNDLYDPRLTWTADYPLSNYYVSWTVSASDPTANDDVDDGYMPLHLWMNSVNNKIYFLVDNTAGAAVWVAIEDMAGVGGTGTENPYPPLQPGLCRWVANGSDTEFDFIDIMESIENLFDNSLLVDPIEYDLSADGTKVVFGAAPTAGHVIVASGYLSIV